MKSRHRASQDKAPLPSFIFPLSVAAALLAALALRGNAQTQAQAPPTAASLTAPVQTANAEPVLFALGKSEALPADGRVSLIGQSSRDGSALMLLTYAPNLWATAAARLLAPVDFTLLPVRRRYLLLRVRTGGMTERTDLSLALSSPDSKGTGRAAAASVRLSDYDYDWADGQWHTVSVPIADLQKTPNGLDPARVDGLSLGLWTGANAALTVSLADIRWGSAPAPAPVVVAAGTSGAATKPAPARVTPQQAAAEKRHQARLALITLLARKVAPGMLRSEVEILFPLSDGGVSSRDRGRYYCDDEVMVEIPYDVTGGAGTRENRVTGPARVYRSGFHYD